MNWLDILNQGEIKIATYPKMVVAYSSNHSVCIKVDKCKSIVDAIDLAITECYEAIQSHAK